MAPRPRPRRQGAAHGSARPEESLGAVPAAADPTDGVRLRGHLRSRPRADCDLRRGPERPLARSGGALPRLADLPSGGDAEELRADRRTDRRAQGRAGVEDRTALHPRPADRPSRRRCRSSSTAATPTRRCSSRATSALSSPSSRSPGAPPTAARRRRRCSTCAPATIRRWRRAGSSCRAWWRCSPSSPPCSSCR